MKLTIIETGSIPADVEGDYPPYPKMFADLIGAADEALSFESVSPVTGDALPDPSMLEAILITGSPASVYDDTPWIADLLEFIRAAADADTPQVGICFGHQALAEALGGKVEKSDKGWGIGRHTYEITQAQDWMTGRGSAPVSFNVSHQDQVSEIPPGAVITLHSKFCPVAGLTYTSAPAISFQGHPEFSDPYARALYTARKGRVFSEELVDEAIASMNGLADAALVAKWIARFLSAHT